MPLDPCVERFVNALTANRPGSPLPQTIAGRRAGFAGLMQLCGPATAVAHVAERTLPGAAGELKSRVYTPLGCEMSALLPGLLYLHGGGLVAGSLSTHDPIARALAAASRCRVVAVDYRLAPEHRFPAAFEDALTAARHIGAHAASFGIDGARFGICGDSAGGTLAAAACRELAPGDSRIALLLLLCPILDYSGCTDPARRIGNGWLVDQDILDEDVRHFLSAGADPAVPRLSPLRAPDMAGMPRTSIHTAEYDPLRDQGADYHRRLQKAGVPVSYTCHPGMIHLFYGLAGVIPYAQAAFRQIGAEVRAALAGDAEELR